jgi:hypothetical protein
MTPATPKFEPENLIYMLLKGFGTAYQQPIFSRL